MKKVITNLELTESGALKLSYDYYEKDKKVGWGITKYSKKVLDEMSRENLIYTLNREITREI